MRRGMKMIATAAVATVVGISAANGAIQTYSSATMVGGVGIDHPGFGFFQYDPGQWDTGLDLAPVLLIYGTGQGFVMPTLISTVLINIKAHDAGSASGVLSTVQQVSFATGVAVIGTVFFSALGSQTSPEAFIHALRVAFTVNICLLMVTFTLIFQIPRFPLRH